MSLWRKRNVKHNEQKHDNLSNPLDRLHEENVRLGLYEIVYDLSIKSEDLSIKSEEAIREVQRLGQEIEQEPVAWYRDEDGIRIYYETKVWDDCTPLYTTLHEEAKINAELRAEIERLKEVSWGVDWGKAGDTPCATIVKRLLNGGIEVLAVEYAPYTLKEKNT
jgi:hypothetical protein